MRIEKRVKKILKQTVGEIRPNYRVRFLKGKEIGSLESWYDWLEGSVGQIGMMIEPEAVEVHFPQEIERDDDGVNLIEFELRIPLHSEYERDQAWKLESTVLNLIKRHNDVEAAEVIA